jgi:hypothetical protein
VAATTDKALEGHNGYCWATKSSRGSGCHYSASNAEGSLGTALASSDLHSDRVAACQGCDIAAGGSGEGSLFEAWEEACFAENEEGCSGENDYDEGISRKLRAESPLRLSQWNRMLRHGVVEFSRERPDTFKRRLCRGIHEEVRWEVWKDLLRLTKQRHSRRLLGSPQQVQELLNSTQCHWNKGIDLDVPRTFTCIAGFDEEYRQSLTRVLIAYANLNPKIGYCQGMSLIVGILLLVSNRREDEALAMFVCLMDDHGLSEFFVNDFPLLDKYLEAFGELLKESMPDLASHFVKERIELGDFMHGWFFSLYAQCLPLATVLIVWDRLMCDGLQSLLPVGISLLSSMRNILLTMSMEDIRSHFKALRTCGSNREASLAGRMLVRRSYQYNIPSHLIRTLRVDS